MAVLGIKKGPVDVVDGALWTGRLLVVGREVPRAEQSVESFNSPFLFIYSASKFVSVTGYRSEGYGAPAGSILSCRLADFF